MLRNINLDVATFAMKKVKEINTNTNDAKKYKTLVKKMPSMIQKNGLIGTLVFNLSKSKDDKNKSKDDKKHDEHKEVLNQIIEWNEKNYKISHLLVEDKGLTEIEYIEFIAGLSSQQYRLITKEMISLFIWLKRFADGIIEGEK